MRRHSLIAVTAAVALVGVLPASAATPSQGEVRWISDPTAVVGDSQLVRTGSGIAFSLRTTGLAPGSANSIWVVVFNNPAACSGGCGADDLGNPAVGGRAVWGAGNVTGASGKSGFAGHVPAGPYDAALLARGGGGAGTGLDPLTAEVHLVVRTHGAAMPGGIDDQIHSFGLGCNPTCMNLQFAVHNP